MAAKQKKSFEESLKELDVIIDELEDGEITLEESIASTVLVEFSWIGVVLATFDLSSSTNHNTVVLIAVRNTAATAALLQKWTVLDFFCSGKACEIASQLLAGTSTSKFSNFFLTISSEFDFILSEFFF